MNQQSIKPYHIHTSVCRSAVGYCQSGVITAQSYPTTRSQLVAIVVPGQGSEEVTDAGICKPNLQCDVLSWYTLHCAFILNI